MKKILTAIILMLTCSCIFLPTVADAKAKEYSGTCGKNTTWHLDKKGKLTISGTGAVTEPGWSSLPEFEEPSNESFIKSIVIDYGITEIGKEIFVNTGIKKLHIPGSVKKIGEMAFHMNCSLKSVSLPEGLECIEEDAFLRCFSLSEITIPSTVTHIGVGAFEDCYRLKKIVNLSSQSYKPERALGKIIWRVGKKKVKVIPAGQTATSTRKKYRIKYVLNGGKLKGKKKTSYQFWEDTKLPKARKKGYVFLGWSTANDRECFVDGTYQGNLKLYAVFKKISIKKISGRKIKVKVKPIYTPLIIQYDTQKNLDKEGYWRDDSVFESTTGIIVTDKDNDGEIITKKLKKGKTYYLRWGLECEEEEGVRWLGKKKIKM